MEDAINADRLGFAEASDKDGRKIATLRGPPVYLSDRKRRKSWPGSRITIYSPPLADDRFTQLGLKAETKMLKQFSGKRRAWLDTLNWQPCDPEDPITRLAAVIKKMPKHKQPYAPRPPR